MTVVIPDIKAIPEASSLPQTIARHHDEAPGIALQWIRNALPGINPKAVIGVSDEGSFETAYVLITTNQQQKAGIENKEIERLADAINNVAGPDAARVNDATSVAADIKPPALTLRADMAENSTAMNNLKENGGHALREALEPVKRKLQSLNYGKPGIEVG